VIAKLNIKRLRKRLLLINITVFAIALSTLCFRGRSVVKAVFWHRIHGNSISVDGRALKLPLLWWDDGSGTAHGSIRLIRASISDSLIQPQIIIKPLMAGSMKNTDEELSRSQLAVISMMNKGRTGQLMSSVVLNTQANSRLYCMRDNVSHDEASLFCGQAGFPNSLAYSGPAETLSEAESILSTLK
jgi:hypothetical protein